MAWTKAEREQLISRLPYVRELSQRERDQLSSPRCEQYRYSKMPMKALRPWGPGHANPPTDKEKYRCKNSARWSFKALRSSFARDGLFCTTHLIHSCLFGDMDEEARTNKWFDRFEKARQEAENAHG
jgi:hypothetical protein